MARPRASDFAEKRQGLLDSAASIFADLGLDKASMAQIATHAGVSKALLYHYYPGKVALLYEIISSHLLDLDAAISTAKDAAADLSPQDRFEALIVAVLENYRGADAYHKVQINAFGTLNAEQQTEIRMIERRIIQHFTLTLEQINPDLPHDRMMPLTMSLFGILNWVYMWFREDGTLSRADYARLARELFVGGLDGVARGAAKDT